MEEIEVKRSKGHHHARSHSRNEFGTSGARTQLADIVRHDVLRVYGNQVSDSPRVIRESAWNVRLQDLERTVIGKEAPVAEGVRLRNHQTGGWRRRHEPQHQSA